MTLPTRTCSSCGITITHLWLTVSTLMLCLSCGTRSAVIMAALTEAGHCLLPCDCAAKAEALNQTGLSPLKKGENT